MNEQEEPVGVDLTAWEAPPPAPGLADAVIARMREPVHAAAIEPVEASRLRWWIAGGAVAAAAAIALIVATRGDEPLTGSGAVAVAKPSRIDLGAASAADLEAHTDVRWVRDGRRIVAMQPRGIANWRVAPEDKLVIDAGATVASVVASGASLRVEVHPMHVTEARLMAGSAVISAAVALVTVKVYEGRVEVTGGGTTTTVAPGATVEIRPYAPPAEPVPVPVPVPVAKAPVLDPDKVGDVVIARAAARTCMGDYNGRLDILLSVGAAGRATRWVVAGQPRQKAIEDCFAMAIAESAFGSNAGASYSLTVAVNPDVHAVVHAEKVTEEQVVLAYQNHQKELRDDAKRRFDDLTRQYEETKTARTPKRLEADAIERMMAANRAALRACDNGFSGRVKVTMTVAPSGAVTRVAFDAPGAPRACLAKVIERFNFGPSTGGTFAYTLVLEPENAADCSNIANIARLEKMGDQLHTSGNYAHALQTYESILTCKPDIAPKTYLVACRARVFPRAKALFRQYKIKEAFAQICLKEGFDPR